MYVTSSIVELVVRSVPRRHYSQKKQLVVYSIASWMNVVSGDNADLVGVRRYYQPAPTPQPSAGGTYSSAPARHTGAPAPTHWADMLACLQEAAVQRGPFWQTCGDSLASPHTPLAFSGHREKFHDDER